MYIPAPARSQALATQPVTQLAPQVSTRPSYRPSLDANPPRVDRLDPTPASRPCLAAGLTLRRTIPESQRTLMLSRARYLNEADRTFLTQLLADGRTCRELAAIAQLNIPITGPASRANVTLLTRQARNTARLMQRRFIRLANRLLHPTFAYLITHLRDMPPTRARLCTLHFMHGLSIRDTARAMNLPYCTVRHICQVTLAKAEALAAATPATRTSMPESPTHHPGTS
ncbi:MAG: hypothetical protein KGS45_00225 [Planctomycetes bacterium]|nr:hypothetical protein [Planctomycetota bacterium]